MQYPILRQKFAISSISRVFRNSVISSTGKRILMAVTWQSEVLNRIIFIWNVHPSTPVLTVMTVMWSTRTKLHLFDDRTSSARSFHENLSLFHSVVATRSEKDFGILKLRCHRNLNLNFVIRSEMFGNIEFLIFKVSFLLSHTTIIHLELLQLKRYNR